MTGPYQFDDPLGLNSPGDATVMGPDDISAEEALLGAVESVGADPLGAEVDPNAMRTAFHSFVSS